MTAEEAAPKAQAPGVSRLVETAEQLRREAGHPALTVTHWLAALLDRHGPMAEGLVNGLDVRSLRRKLAEELGRGETGAALAVDEVIRGASDHAASERREAIGERDVAWKVLVSAGYVVREAQPEALLGPSATPRPGHEPGAASSAAVPSLQQPAAGWAPRNPTPTPVLDQFGQDLTRLASEGKLAPFVGRDEEVGLALETLCRRTKRNPVLVGPPGVGKTAIVEGIAQRIVAGRVPAMLKGFRLIALQPSAVVGGASMMGEIEKRVNALLSEARMDGLILFVDEVHVLIGAGGRAGSGDLASLLKPSLARGDFACIAATTDDEFRRNIEADGALERRFQPVRVNELSPEATLGVLGPLRDSLSRLRGVTVGDEVLSWIVGFAGSQLRNRFFPDKAVDLLEQCVAHAVAAGSSVAGLADAEAVARRLAGIPLSPEERLGALRRLLGERPLLSAEQQDALLARLAVTVRGLDLSPSRPNAVVLLAGDAAAAADGLASAVAEGLFGGAERVVSIDFARFTHHTDVTLLLGAPPGYVGYSESLAIHRLLQAPWSVLCCDNVDLAHPAIATLLGEALQAGFFTDAQGRRIYLSDAVVVLTAPGIRPGERGHKVVGFGTGEGAAPKDEPAADRAVEEALGAALAACCDLVVVERPEETADDRTARRVLADVAARYLAHGLEVAWDGAVARWLAARAEAEGGWERVLDRRLAPLLVAQLPPAGERRAVRVAIAGDRPEVKPDEPVPEGADRKV